MSRLWKSSPVEEEFTPALELARCSWPRCRSQIPVGECLVLRSRTGRTRKGEEHTMEQADQDENRQDQAPPGADDTGQATIRASETDRRRRKAAAFLLLGDALQLLLFGLLAVFV